MGVSWERQSSSTGEAGLWSQMGWSWSARRPPEAQQEVPGLELLRRREMPRMWPGQGPEGPRFPCTGA